MNECRRNKIYTIFHLPFTTAFSSKKRDIHVRRKLYIVSKISNGTFTMN